jgi:predicted nucleic acid-binding protein
LIAASAKAFDLTLVTADEKLIAAPEIKVLANR